MQLPEFKRDIANIIFKRLCEKRKFIQVIIGPRQVGKTTAVQQVISEIKYPCLYATADLLAPPQTDWIEQQWNAARLNLKSEKSALLVLDKIQKISNWSVAVKRLWDEDTLKGNNLQVVILGSSALLLQAGLNESLAGRFEIIRVSHWSWEECKKCFDWPLDKYIYFGGYPGSANLIDDEQRWSQYIRDSLIETAISKDILLLQRIEKPALLRQLFVFSCEYGGQILSYQKLLGQLMDAGNTTTLAHYQQLLESAFLVRGLSKWSGTVLRRRSSSPKWLPLNTALMTAVANRNYDEWRLNPDMWGRLVEVSVGDYLVNEGAKYGIEVYYWRQGDKEIDYIIKKGNKITAIEVKSGRKRALTAGIKLFTEKYPDAKVILVGPDGIEIENFLQTNILKWFE